MLLANNEKVTEMTVKLLGRHPHLTVSELFGLLQQRRHNCSIKAVYKVLNQLEASGVVLRLHRKYSLKLSWISQMLTLLEGMFERTVKDFGQHDLLSANRQTWRFNNLTRFNAFWTQVMLFLLTKSESKVLYDWVPHPWFYLIQPKVEGQFLNTLERLRVRTYRVVGGESYLDRLPTAYWKQTAGATVFASHAFVGARSQYYVIIDDYVLITVLDSKTVTRIEKLYREVDSAFKLDPPRINQVLDAPATIKFRLVSNAKFATELKSKINKLTGHPS